MGRGTPQRPKKCFSEIFPSFFQKNFSLKLPKFAQIRQAAKCFEKFSDKTRRIKVYSTCFARSPASRKISQRDYLEIGITNRPFSSKLHWTWKVSPSNWSSRIKLYMFCVGSNAYRPTRSHFLNAFAMLTVFSGTSKRSFLSFMEYWTCQIIPVLVSSFRKFHIFEVGYNLYRASAAGIMSEHAVKQNTPKSKHIKMPILFIFHPLWKTWICPLHKYKQNPR